MQVTISETVRQKRGHKKGRYRVHLLHDHKVLASSDCRKEDLAVSIAEGMISADSTHPESLVTIIDTKTKPYKITHTFSKW